MSSLSDRKSHIRKVSYLDIKKNKDVVKNLPPVLK